MGDNQPIRNARELFVINDHVNVGQVDSDRQSNQFPTGNNEQNMRNPLDGGGDYEDFLPA